MALGALCLLLAGACIWLARRAGPQDNAALAVAQAKLEAMEREAVELRAVRAQASQYLEQKSAALAQLDALQGQVAELRAGLFEAQALRQQDQQARAALEKEAALARQQVETARQRMEDWERIRAESDQAARASVMKAGAELSSKLLEDHRREAEVAKKEAAAAKLSMEEAGRKHAQTLLEQMKQVTDSVTALKSSDAQTRDKMATVWRALTTPAAAGQLAEIGLENSLKNLDLLPGRDFVMQYSVRAEDGARLRPDAVIFLPQDMVMVVDSKASKFVLEIAEAQASGEDDSYKLAGLADTMRKHLADLVSRDYRKAIEDAYKVSGRKGAISAVVSVMYLPSENALHLLQKADTAIMARAEKAGIVIASPASLMGLLLVARHNIGLVRQSENYEHILGQTQQLMDNMVTALGHAEKMGRGLKSAAEHFSSFTQSVNSRLLPKMQQLGKLGIRPAKAKALPARLPAYELRTLDGMIEIEGEVVADDQAALDAPREVA